MVRATGGREPVARLLQQINNAPGRTIIPMTHEGRLPQEILHKTRRITISLGLEVRLVEVTSSKTAKTTTVVEAVAATVFWLWVV